MSLPQYLFFLQIGVQCCIIYVAAVVEINSIQFDDEMTTRSSDVLTVNSSRHADSGHEQQLKYLETEYLLVIILRTGNMTIRKLSDIFGNTLGMFLSRHYELYDRLCFCLVDSG